MHDVYQTPKLRFPKFSDDWGKMKLGTIGKVSMCKRIMKDETSPIGDIPFYKIGTFGKVADAFITEQKYEEYKSKYSYPKVGEILIAASGATYGKTVVFDGKPAFFQDSNIVWIDNDESKVLNSFLNILYQRIKWAIQESTIPRLYNDIINNTLIYSPCLSEQQKLASFLTSVDKKIELLQKKKGLLEDYKNGVMQQIFSQQLRFKDDFNDDFSPWKLAVLNTLIDKKRKIRYGIVQPGKYDENGRYLIRGKDYSNGWNEPNQFFKVSYEIEKKYSKARVKSGDVILCIVGSVGNVIIIPDWLDGANITQTTARIATDNSVLNNEFLLFYFQSEEGKKMIHKFIRVGTRPGLNIEDVENFKISLPSLKEQIKIADFLSAIDAKIELVNSQLNNNQNFKKGLLQQMFV